jgi:hypothetical protein
VTPERADIRLALAVDAVPPATRLFLALLDLQELVAVVEERRRIRRRCDEIMRDAVAYRSPPEQHMDEQLNASRLLLLRHGFIPRGLRGPLVEQAEAVESANAHRHSQGDARAHQVAVIARAVKRTLHPDVSDVALVFREEEIAEAIDRLKTAEQLVDSEMAYEVLLETLPKFHVGRVRRRLAQGASFEDLIAEDPAIVAELTWLRWLTLQPGCRLADLPYPNLNLAKTEAARMTKDAEKLTLAHAFALAYAAAEDVLNYRRSKPTDPEVLQALTNVIGDMAYVANELWTMEATVEEAANASVLVERLHAGVEREVREMGDAVFHLTKLAMPERVAPEQLAAGAASLSRSVHWVNNALSQFQSVLRAAERQPGNRPARPGYQGYKGKASPPSGLASRL